MPTDVEKLLAAAEAHGQKSEPDHEVGDLQEIVRTCWQHLDAAGRRAVYQEHKGLIADWLDDD